MANRFKRVVPPTFFPIPAGTAAETCPYCSNVVYSIETLSPAKRMIVECTVIGGRAPTSTAGGTGVMHLIYCKATTQQRRASAQANQ